MTKKNENKTPAPVTPNWDSDDWGDDVPDLLAPIWGGEGVFVGEYKEWKTQMCRDIYSKEAGARREGTLLLFSALKECQTEDGVKIAVGERVGVWASAALMAVRDLPAGSIVKLKKLGERRIGDGTRRMTDWAMKYATPKVEAKSHDPQSQVVPPTGNGIGDGF